MLKTLGADVTGSQFLEPDGTFPNHVPNPENKKAIEMALDAAIKNKADLCIIFDTDVDRSGKPAACGSQFLVGSFESNIHSFLSVCLSLCLSVSLSLSLSLCASLLFCARNATARQVSLREMGLFSIGIA